jgi:hypothetical protein
MSVVSEENASPGAMNTERSLIPNIQTTREALEEEIM